MKPTFAHVILILAVALALSLPARGAATLMENVHGYTLTGDRLQSFTGLVFELGKVVETGDSKALHRKFPDAKVIDGGGRTLLPGLIDAHGHVIDLGFEGVRIKLTGTASLKEAQDRIRAYAAANPDHSWLLGQGWNQVQWNLGRFPTARELDLAVGDRPAVLGRIDGHAEWLNTKALAAAGLDKSTIDPAGGRIERDAAGNPTGVLVDKAMDLVERIIPPPNDAERRAALRAALAHMNSVGLTSVGDAGDSAKVIARYREMADRGLLTVRVYAMIEDTGPDFESLSKSGPLMRPATRTWPRAVSARSA
jgi:predicted amidohydrolase YtcJ